MTCDVWLEPGGEIRLVRVSGGPVANVIREAEGWFYLGTFDLPLQFELRVVEP